MPALPSKAGKSRTAKVRTCQSSPEQVSPRPSLVNIEGEGLVEYLVVHASDGSASYVGLEPITGRLAGGSGTFVLQRTGAFEDGLAKESYSVVPGSGTGELCGLRGEGTSALGQANDYPFTLNYELG